MKTKERILDSAEDLFNSYGYIGVGIDLIRDKSGISKTTIYRYFSNKSGLVVAILNRRHQLFFNSMLSRVNSADGYEDKLTSLLAWHCEWFESEDFHGCMFMHALSEFKEKDNKISNIAREHKVDIRTLIDSILKENLSSYDKNKADFIMSILEGLIINVEFFQNPPPFNLCKKAVLAIAHSS